MDYLKVIEQIKEKLRRSNNSEFAQELTDVQLSGGTGGEVLMAICSTLLALKSRDIDSYSKIEYETNVLIEYANSIGLFPQ